MIDCEVTEIDPIKNLLTHFVTFLDYNLTTFKDVVKESTWKTIINDKIATIEI